MTTLTNSALVNLNLLDPKSLLGKIIFHIFLWCKMLYIWTSFIRKMKLKTLTNKQQDAKNANSMLKILHYFQLLGKWLISEYFIRSYFQHHWIHQIVLGALLAVLSNFGNVRVSTTTPVRNGCLNFFLFWMSICTRKII